MTRRGAKSGAMSATWTGPAPKPLSCWLKPPPPKHADQTTVDRGKADGDQRQANEMLRPQLLAKERRRKPDRDRRGEQSDQQRIGRAGPLDDPEIEYVGERRTDDRQRKDGRPCR